MRIDHAVLHISCLIKFELLKSVPPIQRGYGQDTKLACMHGNKDSFTIYCYGNLVGEEAEACILKSAWGWPWSFVPLPMY